MKQLVGRVVTALLAYAVLALPGIAHAQSPTPVIKVNVPFEFNIGNKVFPAGEYSLVEPVQHFVQLRDGRGRYVASAFTSGIDSTVAPTKSVLMFYVSGGRHVLAEMWREGNQLGEQLHAFKSVEVSVASQPSDAHDPAGQNQP